MYIKSRVAKLYRYLKYSFAARKTRIFSDSNDIQWEIDPRNALDAELALGNGYGDYFLRVLQKVEQVNGAAIDVGANAGYWTLPLSKRFDKVMSLEPDPQNFQKLSRNLELNLRLGEKVTALNIAAGSEHGELSLSVRRSIDDDGHLNTGMSSFLASTDVVETTQVQVQTLDSLVSSLQLKDVKLIKIDVEGFEYNVLVGASTTLENQKPLVHWEASFVIETQIGNGYIKECFEFLEKMGYEHYAITADNTFLHVRHFQNLQALQIDLNVVSVSKDNEFLKELL